MGASLSLHRMNFSINIKMVRQTRENGLPVSVGPVDAGRFLSLQKAAASRKQLQESSATFTNLFQLTQETRLRLEVAIPEKQAQALTAGTKATFTLIDYPGKAFTATLSRNGGALVTRNKSVVAEFDIDNSGNGFRSGQYAKVSVQLQRRQPTLWVPASSVVQAQTGIFVVKNEDKMIKRIPVQTGVTKDTLVEVFGNLNAGDPILLKGSEEVKEGTKIAQ